MRAYNVALMMLNDDAYQDICYDSRHTERSEDVIDTASDKDDKGELHCQERKGLSQGVFGLPDAMFSSNIHNVTRIGYIWYMIQTLKFIDIHFCFLIISNFLLLISFFLRQRALVVRAKKLISEREWKRETLF